MKKILRLLFLLLIVFLLIPLPKLSLPYGTLLMDSHGEILYGFLSEDQQWRFQMDANKGIPKKLKLAVLLSEDRRFYLHPGFDPLSLLRAAWVNLKHQKFLQGGSTITMQCIRILDPQPRTLLVKLKEMVQAFKLDMLYSKEKILKLYLSIVPLGGNISGVRAGALKYFGKDIDTLTWAEAATLVALVKSPTRVTLNRNKDKLKRRRDDILKRLYEKKYIDKTIFTNALAEPLPSRLYPMPKQAPHFSFWLKRIGVKGNVKTSLDLTIQRITEEIGKQNLGMINALGIRSYAMVVLDTEEGKILAYVGSPSFYNQVDGQVDGVQAPRSTGSLLKPFLYGLYLDKGMGTEKSLLPDVPIHFGHFSPQNAQDTYLGAVTLKTALIHSLNVPAVWVLHQYGYENFYAFLREAELTTLSDDPERYGLTLVVGGAEGTLLELTNLFRIFSRGGMWSPYIYRNDKKNQAVKKLLSQGAASIIYRILQDLERPEKIYYPIYPEKNAFAWKTGTSFKQRDGWAIGTNAQYTIGVWVGNFSGEGNPNLMGAAQAGPILFQLFSMLPEDNHKKVKMEGVKEVFVCRDSGFLPKEGCEEIEFTLIPKEVKHLPLCPYHKTYYVDESKEVVVCSACWQGLHPVKKSFFLLTPKMQYYSELAGRYGDHLPSHNPRCPLQGSGVVKIIYPEEGIIIKIPKEYDGEYQKIVFKATASSKPNILHWLIDGTYVGDTQSLHTLSVDLKAGKHLVQVIDEEGNASSTWFEILRIS